MMADETVKNRIFNILISCEIGTYTSCYAPKRAVVSISNILALLDNVSNLTAARI